VVVDRGKTRACRRVGKGDVVHPSQTGEALPAHELAAAAIAGWRRWGRALDEWARASRDTREPMEDPVVRRRRPPPTDRHLRPSTASVGTG
jgi:hypothetical protein